MAGDNDALTRHIALTRFETTSRRHANMRALFCIRLHFVLAERIGVEKIGATRFLTIDEVRRRYARSTLLDWPTSRRALGVALLRKAFEDLDAEFFCGGALDLPELVPEPDHFALFLDGHESPLELMTH